MREKKEALQKLDPFFPFVFLTSNFRNLKKKINEKNESSMTTFKILFTKIKTAKFSCVSVERNKS